MYRWSIELQGIFVLPLAPRWVQHSYLSKEATTIPYTCGLSVVRTTSWRVSKMSATVIPIYLHVLLPGLFPSLSPFFNTVISHYQIHLLHLDPGYVALLAGLPLRGHGRHYSFCGPISPFLHTPVGRCSPMLRVCNLRSRGRNVRLGD